MNWPSKCAVVIPCLNEAGTIGSIVRETQKLLRAVIVVDDGSTDQTFEFATQAGAEVVRYERSCGKGTALAAGWQWAQNRGYTWALSLDGDGQHAPSDIPRFLECANTTAASLVVGNRMVNPARIPWLRRHVNQWMSRRISRMTGQELPDTQCGFRLMHLGTWAQVHLKADHFEIESELLSKFIAAGHKVAFVPIQVIYRNERSKIRPVRDTRRWFRWWWQAQGWQKTRV